jgi:hypothetical protein
LIVPSVDGSPKAKAGRITRRQNIAQILIMLAIAIDSFYKLAFASKSIDADK